MEMKIFRSERWKKVEPFFEAVGIAAAFTLLQVAALYIAFHIKVFELYRSVYDRVFFVFNFFYGSVIYILAGIFGDSVLNNEVFFGMFKRMFFILFVINIAYFAYSRFRK